MAVQGPIQLLAAISALKEQNASSDSQEYNDFLLIGGLYSNDRVVQEEIIESCNQISAIWNFKSKFVLPDEIFTRKITLSISRWLLKNNIDPIHIRTVYICRDWQPFNEYVLSTYPKATKVFYGDGMGMLDIKGDYVSIDRHGSSIRDKACLTIPMSMEQSVFERCHFETSCPSHFIYSVYQSALCIKGLQEYCESLKSLSEGKITIVTLGNLTESKTAKDIDSEIAYYLDTISSSTDKDETILIKGHVRQTLGQSKIVAKKLVELGRNAFEIEKFSHTAIDLFIPFIEPDKLVACLSSSCLSTILVGRHEIVFGNSEEIIEKYFFEDVVERWLSYQSLLSSVISYISSSYPNKIDRVFVAENLPRCRNLPIKVSSVLEAYLPDINTSEWENLVSSENLSKIHCTSSPSRFYWLVGTLKLFVFLKYFFKEKGKVIKAKFDR